MALIHTDPRQAPRRRFAWAAPRDVTLTFLRGAALGALGVVCVALALPGANPAAITVALAFYLCAAALTAWFVERHYPHGRLGMCNLVTTVRLILVSALSVHVLTGGGASWAFFGLALVSLMLDGVDGRLARKQGLVSAFGARFDVEVDSLFALILAINAALIPGIGAIALVLGLPRYAFVAAGKSLPWMRRDLPEAFSRKTVCVVQLGTLIAMQAPLLPPSVAVVLVPLVALILTWSFSRDILWLWRNRE